MNNIKLVAIDIGGTLITDDNRITQENIETLKKIKSLGIKISLVTARMYSSTKYISKVIDADFGVFGNGCNVMNLKDTHRNLNMRQRLPTTSMGFVAVRLVY